MSIVLSASSTTTLAVFAGVLFFVIFWVLSMMLLLSLVFIREAKVLRDPNVTLSGLNFLFMAIVMLGLLGSALVISSRLSVFGNIEVVVLYVTGFLLLARYGASLTTLTRISYRLTKTRKSIAKTIKVQKSTLHQNDASW